MFATALSAFVSHVEDHLSQVWLELVLAGLVAILYFVHSKKTLKKGSKRNAASSAESVLAMSRNIPQGNTDQDLTQSQVVYKALRQGKLNEAVSLLQKMPETVAGNVPHELAYRLLITCSKMQKFREVSDNLKVLAGKVASEPLETAITETARNKDRSACRQLHITSGLLSIPKSQKVFETLASAYFDDATTLRALVAEAPSPLGRTFAKIALDICTDLKDASIETEIFAKLSADDAVSLRSDEESTMSLAHLFEKGSAKGGDIEIVSTSGGSSEVCNSDDLDDYAGDTSPQTGKQNTKEASMRANDIRSCGKNGDLRGATKVFERLGKHANSPLIVNSMLDACIECHSMGKAIEYFAQARENKVADVISYNTMMKGYIANGQEDKAKLLLEELSLRGLSATRASFHGLLNARVNAKDFNGAWRLVSDMQCAGISPNAVTCSILLKGRMTSPSDLSRVLALIDEMDQPMDEVLFLSLLEACIRTGRLDMLAKQTDKFMRQDASSGLTAPTYGSMIKAYGQARDLKRIWDVWGQMLAHKVQPTQVTLGCMVEALVGNGRAMEAWQLVQSTSKDEALKHLVNTVIYSSILKGFTNAKDTDKVMSVYEEMRACSIQPNTITFNTILNAFALGGAMNRVPALLDDMKKASPPIEPDIVTYSTIVKGFCNSGSLDRALKVLGDMKASGRYSPDEVMYNSLLGGCAKEHRPDEALRLLEDMRKYNVAPSNYTLSMLVKLMGRCRRINQAFTMLDDISKEYGLKINIQVYTCLIQGCFNAGQATKAMGLHDKILKEGLVPDSMTYTVLVRGCVQAGFLEKAAEMARCAYGFGSMRSKAAPGLNDGCLDELLAALSDKKDLQRLVADLKDCKPAVVGGKGGGRAAPRSSRTTGGAAAPNWRQQPQQRESRKTP
jgi:pentatricopeptide repeat protein